MFALTADGSCIKSGSLDGFLFEIKSFISVYYNSCLLFFRQANIQKECLKNRWLPEKFVYQICFYEYPPALGYATRKSPAVILASLPLPSGGAILPCSPFERRPLKIFQPRNPLGIKRIRAMPLFTIGRNTISKD